MKSSSDELARWFDTDVIIHRVADFLLAAKVTLCGLHRDVPEEKLDLFELTPRHVTEPGACAPEIVRSNLFDADRFCEILDHQQKHLLGTFAMPTLESDPLDVSTISL